MKLRKTESRIPGGFTLANAEKLGYAVMHEDNKHCLVSFFPKDIRLQKPNKDFKNCYVLFTKEDPGTAVSYIWEVEFIYPAGLGKSNLILEVSGLANPSVYCLEASNYLYGRDVPSSLQKIKVTCIIPSDGGTKRVSLIHETKTVDDDILEIIHGEGHSNAIGGNPKTTQLVANFYRGFFHVEPSWEDAVVAVPVNISMGILYQQMMKFNSQNLINELYELKINEDDFDYSAIETQKHKIGLCAIKPHLAALSLDKLNYGRLGSGAGDKTEEDVFNEFVDLDDEDIATYNKYDIFNFSRFPKSSVLLSSYMLHKLLIRAKEESFSNYEGEPSSWLTIKKDEIKHDNELIKYLLTEYGIGPQKSISSFSLNGFSKAMNHDWSSYILKIIEERPVDYEVVRIKVLDIRSGKPVKNAKVKRIIIDAGGGTRIGGNKYKVNDAGISVFENAEHAFSYDPPSYDNDDTVIKKAQIALNELGFDHGSAGSTFGDKGTTQFNKYWEIQSQGNIVKQLSKDELNDENNESAIHLLNAIVYEYESHRQTDRNGILRVQIPKPYLQNPTAPSVESPSVFIEVGFWEFPIALEQLHNTSYHSDFQHFSTPPIIRRNQMESATGFQVSWMEDENLQETDWMNTVETVDGENSHHFGWKVSCKHEDNGVDVETQSYLKVAERIKIKKAGEEFESDLQLFSKFYELKLREYHFVVFGMHWCQPVWAKIPETAIYHINGNISPITGRGGGLVSPISPEDRIKPAMVTTHVGGGSGKGRDYGSLVLKDSEAYSLDGEKFEDSNYQCESILETYSQNQRKTPRQYGGGNNKPHQGIDYYVNDDSVAYDSSENPSPVFAIHGGEIGTLLSRTSANSSYGLQYEVRIGHFELPVYAFYGHLDKKDIALDSNGGNVVMAGQKIGDAGRTFGTDSSTPKFKDAPTHLHFEIRIREWNRRIVDPRDIFNLSGESIDSENRSLILGIDGNRMLPCDCKNGNNRAYKCYLRKNELSNADNKSISSSCWASRNLHCPYLRPDNFSELSEQEQGELNIFLTQAQLQYLYDDDRRADENDKVGYLSPNGIDGGWGQGAQSAIMKFREENWSAIYPDKALADATDDEKKAAPDEATMAALNTFAPYPRTTDSLNRVDT